MTKNRNIFLTTLVAAASAAALSAVPAWADGDTTVWIDGSGATVSGTSYDGDITLNFGEDFAGINADNAGTLNSSEYGGGLQGSWLFYGQADIKSYTFSGNVSGSGFLGVVIDVGNQSAELDMTGANVANFSGQLMGLNAWNRGYTVMLGGEQWTNVEYVFGGVSREWWGSGHDSDTAYTNAAEGNYYALAGDGNASSGYETDTLKLSESTKLAGVTGTSAEFSANNINFSSREYIAAENSGTTLTITGSGSYAFYGTVGADSSGNVNVLDIAMAGSGSQTFGGTNYIGNVAVSAGTLSLVGTTTISGSVTVSENANLVLADNVVFELSVASDGAYNVAVISGAGSVVFEGENGSIGWSDLTESNFAVAGVGISESGRVADFSVATNGVVSFSLANLDLTWSGSSGAHWNTSDANWTSNGTSYTFFSGDNVTFGAAGDSTGTAKGVVLDSGTPITVGDMTVAGGEYSVQGSGTVSGNTLTVASGAILHVGNAYTTATELDFNEIKLAGKLTYQDASSNWKSLEFTEEGAWLFMYDCDTTTGLVIGETKVSANAIISAQWKGKLNLGALSGSANLDITGPTQNEAFYITISDTRDYTGTVSFNNGGGATTYVTLTAAETSAYDNRSEKFVIDSNVSFDVNGNSDTTFELVLAGGTLDSSSTPNGNSPRTAKQLPTVTLTADSTVHAGSGNGYITFGMLATEYGEADLYLGGNTLTKTGGGTFFLVNTSVYNSTAKDDAAAGTIAVSAGTLELDGADASRAAITVASGATLDIANDSGNNSSTVGALTSSGTVNVESDATLSISGDSAISGALSIAGTLAVTNGATVDLTGVTSSQAGGAGTLVISGEGSTVKASLLAHGWNGRETNFGSDMYNATLQIADGGTLEVTAAQTSAETSGGDRAFSVTSGTGTYRYSGEGTSYIDNVSSRNIHIADGSTLDFDVANADATLDVAMKIASGMADSDASNTTTSTGALVKTGAGTLVLSGDNDYSGGTTIAEGMLVVGSGNALGSGTVSIEGGSQLSINSDVTLTNAISLVLTEAYLVSSSADADLVAIAAADSVTYAITGEGTLNATITISADENIKGILADEESCEFAIIGCDYNGDDITLVLGDDLAASYSLSYVSNGVYAISTPEPSMFGVIAGLGALALVATRRHRRRHGRKA
ncbi:MAG: autotransporter-associated beta strand repeat-containing protein [Opitutae bacterium]|nr:autotransporter-associated beta strand repeat-containing protein [Opitutae bacterium]